jgi:hypothetical protein
MTFPPWWPCASIAAKADWLVRTGQAKNYGAACSLLSSLRRRKPPKPEKIRLPYKDDSALDM